VRVKRGDCVLLVVDVQDRLIKTIAEHEETVRNIRAIMKAAQVLHIPVIATEQENLGETVSELKTTLPYPAIRKLCFSCCDSLELMTQLNGTRKKAIIVCGIETHICVQQTVLDLLHGRYRVLVLRDATSSHALVDRETALERMRISGAEVTTCEAIIYELTEKAGTDEFRAILEIVKERRTGR